MNWVALCNFEQHYGVACPRGTSILEKKSMVVGILGYLVVKFVLSIMS